MKSTKTKSSTPWRGWKAVGGCTYEALAWYRIVLGAFLTLELLLRFRFLHAFYSEEGTLPLSLLMPKVDELYSQVCVHCRLHELWQTQLLLSVQVVLAVFFTLGYATPIVAPLCWYLYLSLTLRNTWLNYILDRYFHYLLFFSMFLPLSKRRVLFQSSSSLPNTLICTPATIGFKILITWIYLDAGLGKYMDPGGGWTYNADPLPALDTYARHTTFAQYLYALLGPPGLRIMTPLVVWVELLAAPVALLASYFGSLILTYTAVVMIIAMHIGIAVALRNAALLSFVACTAWILFMPLGSSKLVRVTRTAPHERIYYILGLVCVIAIFIGNIWFDYFASTCDQSVKHIWSPLLHNRWNVFTGAEEYVSWEIAPGILQNGDVVDIWGRRNEVNWAIPGGGAPCTATSRPGRWRSFPYLAELQGKDGEALWSYLCREWDRENNVDQHPERKLVKFNFFMLQADVLPNMTFGPTRKRLIQSYDCTKKNFEQDDENYPFLDINETLPQSTRTTTASNGEL